MTTQRTALPCGCVPHKTRMGDHWGFYCETEGQPYCNFECPHDEPRWAVNDSGNCLVIILIVIVLIVLLGSCLGGGDSGSAGTYECHEAVEAELRNPDTVDFEWSSETREGDTIYGEFTARNDFNAELSYGYSCDVSGGSASVTVFRR